LKKFAEQREQIDIAECKQPYTIVQFFFAPGLFFFIDPHHPTFKARAKFKEILANLPKLLSDEERLRIVTTFLEEYREEYKVFPTLAVIERLTNFMLKPYVGRKNEEYKILSEYTLERHRSKEVQYREAYENYFE
jgi:hypothetical protein